MTKCSLTSIPSYYFKSKPEFILRTSLLSELDELSEDFFNDQAIFDRNQCIIAKLEYFKTSAKKSVSASNFPRTSEAWKKAVLSGAYKLEPDENLKGKSLSALYLAIFHDPDNPPTFEERNCIEKHCLVLDPDSHLAGFARSCEVLQDCTNASDDKNNEKEDSRLEICLLDSFPTLDSLQDFVDSAMDEVVRYENELINHCLSCLILAVLL